MVLEVLGRLAAIADGQWGMVTQQQAYAAGADDAALDELRRHELVDDVADGVARLRAGGRHPFPRLYAAWLLLEPQQPGWLRRPPGCGVVSHAAALRLYRAGDVPGPAIEFTVPGPGLVSGDPGVVIHVATLIDEELQELYGMPVTNPGRALSDVAATGRLDVPELGYVARALLRSGQATADELAAALLRHPSRDLVHRDLDELLAAAAGRG